MTQPGRLDAVVQNQPCDSQAGGVAVEEETGPPWLAAYTRPRFEFKVKEYCEERGIEAFLPTYQSWRKWSDRKKLLRLPLFPSYVFVRHGRWQQFRSMQAPGFLWFVHNHGGPVLIDSTQIEAIQILIRSKHQYDPLPAVKIGEEVEIVSGSMRGVRGYLLQKQSGRIALWVSSIGAGVRVHLPDPSWLRSTSKRRPLHDAAAVAAASCNGR